MVVSLLIAIKKFRVDLIEQAIQILIDNPDLTNCAVAKQIGVGENAIRRWKKLPLWEEIKKRIERDRIEAIKLMARRNQEEYIRKLEQRIAKLEKFEGGVDAIAARLSKSANDSLTELSSKHKSPTKACSEAVKHGTVFVSEKAIKAVESVTRLYKDLYEFDLILNFLRENDGDEDEEE